MIQTKLAIIGVGHVGSQVLTDCSHLNLFSDIVLIDSNEETARGEALDHRHALAASYRTNSKIYAGDYADCADADVIIISAGVSEKPRPGEEMPPRALMGKENAVEIRKIMAGITQHTKDAIIILITNPVDTITYIAENEFDYPKGKIFGTGTTLDTFRYRQIVAAHYQVDPKERQRLHHGRTRQHRLPGFQQHDCGCTHPFPKRCLIGPCGTIGPKIRQPRSGAHGIRCLQLERLDQFRHRGSRSSLGPRCHAGREKHLPCDRNRRRLLQLPWRSSLQYALHHRQERLGETDPLAAG